ncbi:MAG: NAD-dependent epimerase/dehydratase family protein [Alphaproteobacteria bacterium]|nr:NAD-dependent epimerase/dehydratase family protein [Alphaproteobacteria bacterium]
MGLRVALTGGTGFSGAHIIPALLDAGHSVAALARRPDALKGQAVDIIEGDLADQGALHRLVDQADVVVHAAAATSAKNRAGYFAANLDGTRHVFQAARMARVKRFVFVSSLAAREPLLSGYAASKAAAEHYVTGQHGGPEVLILRPPAIYGPGDRATLPLMKALRQRRAFVPGRRGQKFSLLHVRDFGAVIAAAVGSDETGLVELGFPDEAQGWESLAALHRGITGLPRSMVFLPKPLASSFAALAELAAQVTGRPSMVNTGKVNELYHRDWVAREVTNLLQNPTPLADGLAETLGWYEQQGWLPPLAQKTRTPA